MKFKDLKANDYLYSFNSDTVSFDKLLISDVSQPRVDTMVVGGYVVDVTTSKGIMVFKAEDTSGMTGNTYYSPEFNEVLNQIKALNSSLQIQLDTLDKVKSDKKSCEKLLADLDPDIKERQRVDGRLNKVEQKVTEISSDISEIKESLKKLLSK